MNSSEFFIEQLGKENDSGSVKGACVNLIKSFYTEVLGLTPFIGNANQYVNETRIPKVTGKPQPNDIVVFNYGTDGHIGLCVWSREQDFECMEQNSPIGSPCHYIYHTDFQNIIGILRPNLPENTTPRPTSQVPGTSKFTMAYTAINSDPTLLEQARQLLVQYSGGRIDCSFQYSQLPPIYPLNGKIFSREEQIQFLHNFPIPTRYGFVSYMCSIPGYFQMTTAEISQTPNIVTFATFSNKDPMYFCYEFVNALEAQALSKGIVVPGNNDIFTPSEDFIKAKLTSLLPYLDKLS